MSGQKANEHRPVGSEETSHRGSRLGSRGAGDKTHTKIRVIGDGDSTKQPLDVAAFNSFIG